MWQTSCRHDRERPGRARTREQLPPGLLQAGRRQQLVGKRHAVLAKAVEQLLLAAGVPGSKHLLLLCVIRRERKLTLRTRQTDSVIIARSSGTMLYSFDEDALYLASKHVSSTPSPPVYTHTLRNPPR